MSPGSIFNNGLNPRFKEELLKAACGFLDILFGISFGSPLTRFRILSLLFSSVKGSELRARIKNLLKAKGIDFTDDEVQELVDQISEEIVK